MNQPARDWAAARDLLGACAECYGKAQAEGRLAAWAKMAHSVIDLLESKQVDQPVMGVMRPGLGEAVSFPAPVGFVPTTGCAINPKATTKSPEDQ